MLEDEPYYSDEPIPDSLDPERAAAASRHLKSFPAMPLGNGTYYQPGAFLDSETSYVDAFGQPVPRINIVETDNTGYRMGSELNEWMDAAAEGEEALIALEAKRQRQRLEANGIAASYKDADVCAGGKRRDACSTARTMVSAVLEQVVGQQFGGSGESWEMITQPLQCTDCQLLCCAAAQLYAGTATGVVRFINTRSPNYDSGN